MMTTMLAVALLAAGGDQLTIAMPGVPPVFGSVVTLSTNVSAAMIAGQIRYGVLHLDDVPVLEEQLGRPVSVVSTFHEINQLSHYLAIVALRDRVKQKRDAYVRMLAGIIDATSF